MSANGAGSSESGGSAGATRSGSAWRWMLVVVGAAVLTALLVPSGSDPTPYDLGSAAPDGYRGLRLLLDSFGVTTERISAGAVNGDLTASVNIVFVPEGDRVGRDVATQLEAFANRGGRVVLGAPTDWLGPRAVSDPTAETGSSDDACTMPELADAGGASQLNVPFSMASVVVGPGDEFCYGDEASAEIVRTTSEIGGGGELITVGSPDLFANDAMGLPAPGEKAAPAPANAVVAQRLLGQRRGAPARLAVVTSGLDQSTSAGDKTLLDFMSPGVRLGLLEIAVAVAFFAIARGRRFGRVVTEPEPVRIAGSAFVEAVGSLLERQGDIARAAEVVREGNCRELARRLGQPAGTGRAGLAAVVAARTGRDPTAVHQLFTQPVDSEAELLALTRDLDALRQEATHV